MTCPPLNPWDVNRRSLGDPFFVEAIKGWFRWRVDVRYWFGPFAPRVSSRSFWRREDAERAYWDAKRP